MKLFISKPLLFAAVVFLFTTASNNPRQTDKVYETCRQQISEEFIQNGQPMRALLTGAEVAEFRTTMFEGNTYRITACTPGDEDIWFSVYDTNDNLIFSSAQHDHSNTWDFKMEGNMECVIEAGLLSESSDSGMALILIGFKNAEIARH
ncbi:MAG: hypothetical protein R6U46_11960 [Marinilabilia sp.]